MKLLGGSYIRAGFSEKANVKYVRFVIDEDKYQQKLIKNIQCEYAGEIPPHLELSSQSISKECFAHFAQFNFSECSPDEIENYYYNMLTYLNGKHRDGERGIYYLLPRYMENVVELHGDIPCCKYREM